MTNQHTPPFTPLFERACFTSAGFMFTAYTKADGQGRSASRVKVTGVERHAQGKYGSFREATLAGKSYVLNPRDMQMALAVLYGKLPEFRGERVRRGEAPKAMSIKRQPGQTHPYYLELRTPAGNVAGPLTLTHGTELALAIRLALEAEYPEVSTETLVSTAVSLAAAAFGEA